MLRVLFTLVPTLAPLVCSCGKFNLEFQYYLRYVHVVFFVLYLSANIFTNTAFVIDSAGVGKNVMALILESLQEVFLWVCLDSKISWLHNIETIGDLKNKYFLYHHKITQVLYRLFHIVILFNKWYKIWSVQYASM